MSTKAKAPLYLETTEVPVARTVGEITEAEFAQVFLPYSVNQDNRTLWEELRDTQFKRIEAPKPQ